MKRQQKNSEKAEIIQSILTNQEISGTAEILKNAKIKSIMLNIIRTKKIRIIRHRERERERESNFNNFTFYTKHRAHESRGEFPPTTEFF